MSWRSSEVSRSSELGGIPYASTQPIMLPRRRSGSLSSPLGRLCGPCRSIDLDTIFKRERDSDLSRGTYHDDVVNCNAVDLGTVDSWHPTCVLCTHLRSDYRVKQEIKLRKQNYWHLSFPGVSFVYRGLRLDHREQVPMSDFNLGKPGPSDVFILPVEEVTDTKPGPAACIIPSKVDFNIIGSWLHQCEREHRGECYNSDGHKSHVNRMIDCESRNLVPHDGEDYVALSYVWGNCTPPTLEEDSFVRDAMRLPSILPQTIEDAITITIGIGKRYLWVDRYCVNQYHSDQKVLQIDAMGDIYEGAAVTIIALVDDAHDAIPGISQERIGQLLLDSSTARYISTCQFMRDVVDQALYSQRAWTYQEFILSKRLMVFSKSQVFFTCGLSNFQEGIILPSRQGLSLRGDSSFSLRASMMQLDRPTRGWMTVTYRQRLEDLRESIVDYSQRTLTYSSDGLNAFRGILTRSGLKTFYGHPIHVIEDGTITTLTRVVGDRRGFSRSLLWPALINRYNEGAEYESVTDCLSELQANTISASDLDSGRGSSLPTWSWASSRPVSMIWMWEKKDLRSPTFESRYCSFPTIHIIDENMQELTLIEAALRCESRMMPEKSPRLIFNDAVVLKHLDVSAYAGLAQNYDLLDEKPRAKGFEAWKSPDMGLDPSARREILEIINGNADMHAILIDASSTNPVSFYERDQVRSSRYLNAYFDGEVQLKFLLVHQKGNGPCKRVGRLTCQLEQSDQHEDQIVFHRERIELI